MGNVSLNLVVLRSADIEQAVTFYTLLGLEFVKEQHGTGPEHLACDLGSVVFEIYPAAGKPQDSLTRIGFSVSSVAETVDAVRNSGGVVLAPPKDGRWGMRAVVADPDGHRVELVEQNS